MNIDIPGGARVTQIYKYAVAVDDELHDIELNQGADILAVAQPEIDRVVFWAPHFADRETVVRRFIVVGTGHPFPAYFIHRGTATNPASPFVWHLLESP